MLWPLYIVVLFKLNKKLDKRNFADIIIPSVRILLWCVTFARK